ncbi:MAG: porin family protein [Bacteroidetes bacterium]|nr:porin family protein [Bacteroidota bacterium]
MKNRVFKLIVATVLISSLFSIKSNAQEINLGGGLLLGTDRPSFGLQFKGTYGMDMVLENLSGSLEFGIFFPLTQNSYKYNRWSIDVDGNYTFWSTAGFNFYGIGGLNITHYSRVDDIAIRNNDEIGTKVGLNAGAGANYEFSSNLSAFSEIKYTLSRYNQTTINFGVLFAL